MNKRCFLNSRLVLFLTVLSLLFIVLGCEQDNPDAQPTPDNYEQEAQQDKIVANGNKHQETPMDAPVPGKPFTNSIGMKLVYIPPGEFMMGSRDSATGVARKVRNRDRKHFLDEHPQHRVEITRGFYMSTTEVTQAQYRAIMRTNPSRRKGEDNPVEQVSWNDAVEFCRKLSENEGRTYLLPTEAEWEYACRAGTTTPFYTGETISTSQANYEGNYVYGSGTKGVYRKSTIAVGSFPPNAFGLYDMHGNVYEWCQDWYGKSYYAVSPTSNPQGPSSGEHRVIRGGSWFDYPGRSRSATRSGNAPDFRISFGGFRILLDS